MCGPRDKDTNRGVVHSLGIWQFLPSFGVVFLSLAFSHVKICLSSVRDEGRNRGYSCKQRGIFFHLPGFPLSVCLSCPHFVWFLHPLCFPLNILIKQNCTEGSTNARACRQVVKFLIEFSQRSQTKHKTALTQKCEGGREEGEERREGSYFLWFLRLCGVFP